jgi:hypothetical protein
MGRHDAWVSAIRAPGIKILALVFDPPDWALSTLNREAPPTSDQDLVNFMVAVASHYRGQNAAYELWNEPNLTNSWGQQGPNPQPYAKMLGAVYPPFEAADPDALLVTGGLANAGDKNDNVALGNLLFIKYLYRPSQPSDPTGPCSSPAAQADLTNGARGSFDVLAIHPYGGPWPPDAAPSQVQYCSPGVYFRRAEQARQKMEVWGCDDKPIRNRVRLVGAPIGQWRALCTGRLPSSISRCRRTSEANSCARPLSTPGSIGRNEAKVCDEWRH